MRYLPSRRAERSGAACGTYPHGGQRGGERRVVPTLTGGQRGGERREVPTLTGGREEGSGVRYLPSRGAERRGVA